MVIADPATPAPSGFTTATIGDAIEAARNAAKPLQLRPGTYDMSNIDIATTSGSGRGIEIFCAAGEAILRLTGGNYGLRVSSQTGMTFRNIVFDGESLGLPAYSAPNVITAAAGLVIVDNVYDVVFSRCTFRNTAKTAAEPAGSYKAALLCVNDSRPRVSQCNFNNIDVAVWAFSSEILVEDCRVIGAKNNGIAIYGTIGSGGNLSVVRNNFINFVDSDAGTGANGNGISAYLANDVSIVGNTIFNCAFSAVRVNAGSRAFIEGNSCWNIREACLYYEAPAAGQDGTGATIVNNRVDTAGAGINVANSGYYGDGVARRSIVAGNQIGNLVSTLIPGSDGVGDYETGAIGITVEQDSVVSGNIIEGAAGGIKLGVAQGARDLVCDGNLIRGCGVGIAFSSSAEAGKMVISNNIISGAGANAIVSAATVVLIPPLTPYDANLSSQTAGSAGQILIAGNRAS
ncbi:TIGR03808 family TAT-translocated repetitive protein [Bosea minatitlanensis]|uniref:TIGR03808 family TAT-translocated repetitive protein n=2 Tax=Bosea minatitlanensis TaxID=128782 RepID=A0ABW0F4W1_9HYPH